MRNRVVAGLGPVVSLFVAGGLLTGCQHRQGQAPVPEVAVEVIKTQPVTLTTELPGRSSAYMVAEVRPQVNGIIQQRAFTEGSDVKAGALLYQIDPAPFQAALNQAVGALAHDEASLADARLDLQRYNTLVAQNSIASQTRDTQAALVKQDEGLVASDQGLVGAARLNLQWSRIVSPVAGRVGLRQVDAGNQVSANGSTPIAVVTQIDPIDVIFAVSEDAIPSIVRHPNFGAGLPVTAYDRAGGAAIGNGSLATIDNVVDTTTGTVKGKARFANPTGALFPNQFVNITVLVDTLKNQVVVPTTAVRHGAQGDYAWVLQPDRTVKARPVKVGPGTAETVSLASGLAIGETVITDGGDRLRDGGKVILPGAHAGGGRGGPGGGHHGHGGGGGAPPPSADATPAAPPANAPPGNLAAGPDAAADGERHHHWNGAPGEHHHGPHPPGPPGAAASPPPAAE